MAALDGGRARPMLAGVTIHADLSGDWEGHYVQDGRAHGISMRVVQRGQSFVGEMRDADTLLAGSQKLDRTTMGGDTMAERLFGEVEILAELPERSVVEGEVQGRVVTVTKTYQGPTHTSVRLAGKTEIVLQVTGHAVRYLGTVAYDGRELAGHWSIDPKDGSPRLRDRFLLRRGGS